MARKVQRTIAAQSVREARRFERMACHARSNETTFEAADEAALHWIRALAAILS